MAEEKKSTYLDILSTGQPLAEIIGLGPELQCLLRVKEDLS